LENKKPACGKARLCLQSGALDWKELYGTGTEKETCCCRMQQINNLQLN